MKHPPFFFRAAALAVASALFLCACTSGNDAAPAAPKAEPPAPAKSSSPAGTRTFELLARHDVDAVFAGTREHVCRGMTSLCPDKCGASGTLAVFRVERYNAYEKPGKYGDPKTDEFSFMLQSTTGTSDVSPETAAQVRALKPAARVRLVWEHIYVTDENGSRFPERVVRKTEPLPPAAP